MKPARPQHQPIELLRIGIPMPCSASWEDMTGDHRVRHCAGCDKNVVNLSAIAASEGAALIAGNLDGHLCVRMDTRPDGSIVTADGSDSARSMARQPWRRLPGVAGAAVLALSAAGCAASDPKPVAPGIVDVRPQPALPVTERTGTDFPVAPVPAQARPPAPTSAPAKKERKCEKDAVHEQLIGKPAAGYSMPYVFRDSKGFCKP